MATSLTLFSPGGSGLPPRWRGDKNKTLAGAGEYRAVGYSPANKSAGALMRVNNKSALFTR